MARQDNSGMLTCRVRGMRAVEMTAIAATIVFGLSGCASPPKLPDQVDSANAPSPPYPPSTFKDAIKYAYETQKSYSEWLDWQLGLNLYAGLAEVALAGAALGLGTVGGNTNAVAALAAAAGATVAADQWVIGSATKDPRYKAYANAIIALQCVADDAWAAVPKSPDLRPENQGLDDVNTITRELANKKEKDVTDKQRDLILYEISQDAMACADDPAMLDARLAVAEATAAIQRAETLKGELASLPMEIVQAVHAIHWQAYTVAVTSFPDITTIKVTSAGGKAAPQPAPGRLQLKAVQPCHMILLDSAAKVRNSLADLNQAIAGVVLPQPRFAECTKPADTTSTAATPPSGTGKPAAPTQSAAAMPLTILPSTELYAKPSQSQSIMISGGRQPLFLVSVDPGLQVTRKPTTSSGATEIQLSLKDARTTGRLLVTDFTGEQSVISLETIKQ